MSSARALLFDLDGTLVDSACAIATALSRIAVARGAPPVDIGAVRGLISRGAAVLVRETLGPFSSTEESDLAEFRTELRQVPVDPDTVYPGVRTALDTLAATGHRMAVVTNKPERLALQLLDAVGLTQFFDVVVGGDTLSTCKPDPAPLHHALEQLGGTFDHALMVGDSEVDAAAAAAAGLGFLLFEGGYGPLGSAAAGAMARFVDFHDVLLLAGQELAVKRLA